MRKLFIYILTIIYISVLLLYLIDKTLYTYFIYFISLSIILSIILSIKKRLNGLKGLYILILKGRFNILLISIKRCFCRLI